MKVLKRMKVPSPFKKPEGNDSFFSTISTMRPAIMNGGLKRHLADGVFLHHVELFF